jgi:putative peptidoglycan lipid II flippase
VVALIFEHGGFTATDTHHTTQALRFALLGLIFAAVDQPFIFAFYARQDTWTPALVGMAGVFVYLLAALLPTLFAPLTLNRLILANSIQLAFHALVMLWLLQRDLGGLRQRGLSRLTLKASGASLAMGGGTWLVAGLLDKTLLPGGLVAELSVILGAAAVGFGIYVILMTLLRADSGELLRDVLRRRRAEQL